MPAAMVNGPPVVSYGPWWSVLGESDIFWGGAA